MAQPAALNLLKQTQNNSPVSKKKQQQQKTIKKQHMYCQNASRDITKDRDS